MCDPELAVIDIKLLDAIRAMDELADKRGWIRPGLPLELVEEYDQSVPGGNRLFNSREYFEVRDGLVKLSQVLEWLDTIVNSGKPSVFINVIVTPDFRLMADGEPLPNPDHISGWSMAQPDAEREMQKEREHGA